MKTVLVVGAVAVGLYALWRWSQPQSAMGTLQGTDMTSGGQQNTVYGPSGMSPGTTTIPAPVPSVGNVGVPNPITAPVPSNWYSLRRQSLLAIAQTTPPAPSPWVGFSTPTLLAVRGTTSTAPIK